MIITVDRFISDNDTTISRVSVDEKFECFGLEDEYRRHKLVQETRIPAGTYLIAVRNVGGFHIRYAEQFPDMHKGMLHILNVPGFDFILIHCGNTQSDTSGCLLVGSDATTEAGNMSISKSRIAYQKLYQRVIDSAIAGELSIEFNDNDRG